MAPETGEDTRRRRGEERRGRGLCRAGKKGRLDGGWPVSVVGEVRRERNIAVKERLVSAVSDSGSDECSTRQKDKSGDAFVCYTRKRGEETEIQYSTRWRVPALCAESRPCASVHIPSNLRH